ncbi:MAG: hypothetical protein PHD86_04660 [Kiritimatiellae bacterium]|nr:hypothetical protein [Kiritimatiellia bacterium]
MGTQAERCCGASGGLAPPERKGQINGNRTAPFPDPIHLRDKPAGVRTG